MEDVKWHFNVRRRFSWFVDFFQIVGTNRAVFQKVLGIDFAYSNMKKDADYNEFTDEKEEEKSIALLREKTSENLDFLQDLAKKSTVNSLLPFWKNELYAQLFPFFCYVSEELCQFFVAFFAEEPAFFDFG